MAKRNADNGEFRSVGPRGGERGGKFVVREAKTGRFLEVRGANSMPSNSLTIKKGVDLTKPIAKQILRGLTIKEPKGKAH